MSLQICLLKFRMIACFHVLQKWLLKPWLQTVLDQEKPQAAYASHFQCTKAQTYKMVLRKEVLEFLQNLADPISIILHGLTNEVHLQASRFLFSIAVNGILMIYLVYLPVTLAIWLAPTIFPLHISVSEPFTEIPVVMLLLQLCLPYAIELRETVADLIHQWVTSVCCVLGLSDFLCSRPGDIGGKDNVKVETEQDEVHDGIAAQDPKESTFTSQNFDGVENCASDPSDNGYALVLRVVLLVVLAWITWLLFSSSLTIVSLPLGHVLFSFFSNLPITHGIECNDLYAFFIANISIWTSFTGARYFIRHFKLKAGITPLRFRDFCKLFCIIVESCVILSLWIIVIPVLIGLLFEFSFMVPVGALVVKGPPLLLCQDWAVGFFFFKLGEHWCC
ncbi:probable E3 ubiquitin ligase SUD1 isoform X1 [Papaver somniferum]|uniref:probable E3 ubiquitin ligase SUD1 isoform X1 n=1 Tax=Papaver somniferum TaxID=3469 RepID=UPI000E700FC5|nr:probable E3 ubiquitin ligase SUD1 isoform X1 [Papaver somniferum]XP_026394070.1 probable E3 ubiquitin ligase SUD1 isoform X1 [Papaver somniferum]